MKKNSPTSTSSPALVVSHLRESGQDSKQLSSVRKKSSVKKSSRSIGQESRLSKKSETSMERNGEEQLYLPEVSPASLSPLPGSEEARKMTVIYGQKCSGLLVRQNPVGYLQRMCLESSAWHSTRCLLIWKGKVTPRGRLLFQLVVSMPRTEGTESGLLRTPSDQEPGIKTERLMTKKGEPAKVGKRAYDKITGRLAQVGLHQQLAMLPTPQANEKSQYHSKDKGMALSRQIKLLRTPRASDWKGGITGKKGSKRKACDYFLPDQLSMLPTPNAWDGRRGPGKELNMKSKSQKDRTLETVMQKDSLGKKTGMKLQPAFVEWMMGFPIGYTDLKHSEMQSCHKSHSKLLKTLPK